jgi:hypothetical protein
LSIQSIQSKHVSCLGYNHSGDEETLV